MSGWLEDLGICPCDLGALTTTDWVGLAVAGVFVLLVFWMAAS